MYCPPKLHTIICLSALFLLTAADVFAQTGSNYESRARAIRAARARAMNAEQYPSEAELNQSVQAQPIQQPSAQQLLQDSMNRVTSQNVAPVQYQENVQARPPQNQPVQATRSIPQRRGRHLPNHLRTAQLTESPISQGSGAAPRVMPTSPAPISQGAPIQGAPMMQSVPGTTSMQSGPVVQGAPVQSSPVIGESYLEGCQGGACEGGCADCGSIGQPLFGGSFRECNNCPPMPYGCWLDRFGGLFRNGEYFAGAMAFRGPGFNVAGQQIDDGNYGFYGGANFGIPLCRLTCGILSGQLGIRSNQSNFDGSSFSPDNRDQLFITAGFYRRVDYGIQIGVVADILHEEWFLETDLVQIRTDIGWVYGNGGVLGFRSTNAAQGDVTQGIINGTRFSNFQTTVVDQYRFYYRHSARDGGFAEVGLGWTEDDHFIASLDFDLQITDCVGMQSGFAYFLGDDQAVGAVASPDNDAWNIYVGLVWRPQGRGWWGNYDRPLFDVVDNGSMLMRHQ